MPKKSNSEQTVEMVRRHGGRMDNRQDPIFQAWRGKGAPSLARVSQGVLKALLNLAKELQAFKSSCTVPPTLVLPSLTGVIADFKFRPHKRRDPAACPLTTTIPSFQAQLPLPLRSPLLPDRAPSRGLHSLLSGSLHIVPGYSPAASSSRTPSSAFGWWSWPVDSPLSLSLSYLYSRRVFKSLWHYQPAIPRYAPRSPLLSPLFTTEPRSLQVLSGLDKIATVKRSPPFASHRPPPLASVLSDNTERVQHPNARGLPISPPGMAGYGGCQLWARGMLSTSEWRPNAGEFNNGDFFHSMVDLLKNPDNTCAACLQGVHTVRRRCASTPDRRSDFGPAHSSFWNGDGIGVGVIKVSTLVWINHRVLRIPIHTLSVGKLLHFRRFSAASFLFEIIDELNLEPIMFNPASFFFPLTTLCTQFVFTVYGALPAIVHWNMWKEKRALGDPCNALEAPQPLSAFDVFIFPFGGTSSLVSVSSYLPPSAQILLVAPFNCLTPTQLHGLISVRIPTGHACLFRPEAPAASSTRISTRYATQPRARCYLCAIGMIGRTRHACTSPYPGRLSPHASFGHKRQLQVCSIYIAVRYSRPTESPVPAVRWRRRSEECFRFTLVSPHPPTPPSASASASCLPHTREVPPRRRRPYLILAACRGRQRSMAAEEARFRRFLREHDEALETHARSSTWHLSANGRDDAHDAGRAPLWTRTNLTRRRNRVPVAPSSSVHRSRRRYRSSERQAGFKEKALIRGAIFYRTLEEHPAGPSFLIRPPKTTAASFGRSSARQKAGGSAASAPPKIGQFWHSVRCTHIRFNCRVVGLAAS
ncbi:hypothetical protein C8J57DRAFT_1590317 [Mycena rebaudengoi]|nr:hypothetical protein C8J57DRAFT_1590317 [Mycena rebaudengoi]